jgi:hypothetical protein
MSQGRQRGSWTVDTGPVRGEHIHRWATTRACGGSALVAVVLVLVVIAYYPFAWSPPRKVDNGVTRNADGSLQFGDMNYARTLDTPRWVPEARESSTIRIQLEVNPQSGHEQASMLMLATDYSHGDFSIQQYDSYLLVWLRRPGSDITGHPPIAVAEALQPQRWNRVDLTLVRGDLTIAVEGTPRLTQHLSPDALHSWGAGQIALGDEVQGGDPWRGQIRVARVRTAGYDIDYVRPGALAIPRSFVYLPDHLEPFPPVSWAQWLRTFLDMLSFIPLGFLIVVSRRPLGRPLSATLPVAALALVLAAGKVLFEGRHTSVAVVVLQIVGGIVGALLASWLARRAARLGGQRQPEAVE